MALDLQTVLKRLAGNDPAIEAGLGAGGDLGQLFFGEGSLGRVDESIDPMQTEALTQAFELVGRPGRMVDEQTALNKLGSSADSFGGINTKIRNVDAAFGPDVMLAMEQRRNRLGGFTQPERAAFLDEGQEGIDRNLATTLRQAALNNMGGNRRGAASFIPMAGLQANNAAAQRGLQRDFAIANANRADQNLGSFQELATGLDTERFGRQMGLDNTRFGRELDRQNSESAAMQRLVDATRLQRAQDIQNSIARQGNLQNILQQTRNDLLSRRLFNLNQLGQEKSGQFGSIFGSGGFAAEQAGRQQAFDLGQQQIELAKQSFQSQPKTGGGLTVINTGGSGASAPTPTTSTGYAQPKL